MTDPRIVAILERTLDVPDFPKPGVLFKDMSPALADAATFKGIVDLLAEAVGTQSVDAVVGVEARGFVLGAALAYRLDAGFVPVRKSGKLPRATHREAYSLEYGDDALEIHRDAFADGGRVVMVDDVLATGGTAEAASKLVERAGGIVVQQLFLLELGFLKGALRIDNAPHRSLIRLP